MSEENAKRIIRLPPEVLKAKGYVAYLHLGSMTGAAKEIGVTQYVMEDWIREENWDIERAKYYDQVITRVKQKMESLIEKRANIAVALADKLLDSISTDIELSELGSKKEAYEMIKIGIDALNKITGQETGNVDDVMDGYIDEFLKAYLMMMGQKEEDNNNL